MSYNNKSNIHFAGRNLWHAPITSKPRVKVHLLYQSKQEQKNAGD